jgi:hypothetical protein
LQIAAPWPESARELREDLVRFLERFLAADIEPGHQFALSLMSCRDLEFSIEGAHDP